MAAALLFPAVAAIHGIVLATLHIEGKLWIALVITITEIYRCRRHGYLWSLAILLGGNLGWSSNSSTIADLFQRTWQKHHILVDRAPSRWLVVGTRTVTTFADN